MTGQTIRTANKVLRPCVWVGGRSTFFLKGGLK